MAVGKPDNSFRLIPAMVDSLRSKKSAVALAYQDNGRLARSFGFSTSDYRESRFRIRLYRFMAESIPLISSVIWTWSRLAAAPGEFGLMRAGERVDDRAADQALDQLFQRINRINFGRSGGEADLLPPFFQSLFLDGAAVGRLTLTPDLAGVEEFRFFDLAQAAVKIDARGQVGLTVANESDEVVHRGPDLFYYALNADLACPYGRSILRSIPFIAYVEQQLIDDMRRSMHNSGYHRLHVRIKPPDKKEGESDEAYTRRANGYFDGTVAMIKEIEPEDNPITWDDVAIEYIGPRQGGGVRSQQWYLSHRAMVEEICSGTHLAPFILGYSHDATTNWAQFKYDLVMRQVRSVQNAAANFLNWLANIELALKGFDLSAHWRFDNRFSVLAGNDSEIKNQETRRIIDLFNAGLIDRDAAASAAARLVSQI